LNRNQLLNPRQKEHATKIFSVERIKIRFKLLFEKLQSDSGSAIVEFVALAIPLFIPVFIYLNHFSSVSGNEEIARAMAREVLRVYVISENDSAAQELSTKASFLLAKQWNLSDSERSSIRNSLECSANPCLTANGKIRLTVSFTDEATGRKISASAQEHLSPWL
jgi:Flp pilus assembly protein TadG